MKVFLSALWLAALLLSPGEVLAAEIKVVPGDYIVLNPVNPDKGYWDLLIHAIVVGTAANESALLERATVSAMSNGQAVLVRNLAPDELVQTSLFFASGPLPEFLQGQILDPRGLAGLYGHPMSLARSPLLAPSEALIAARLHFSIGFPVDAVEVTAMLRDKQGHEERVTANVPVRRYNPAIAYHAPLAGTWLMQAIPTAASHHRFNPSTEFAVDFFKVDADGSIFHGDSADAHNYPGYGAPVMAAADGLVVAAIADQIQDRAALLPRSSEPDEAFFARVDRFHMMRMQRNFRAANAGNMVTIRHESKGLVEFSSYGHLRSGSVRVKPGDRVKQGDVIGEVGDTGDSAAVHLHFQINAGPDAFTSKSLPGIFTDLGSEDREPGRFVTKKNP